MTESRDYLELTFRSINCFADDGTLDEEELQSLIDIALRDGVVDDNERRVLENIFSRVRESELSQEQKAMILQVRNQYQV